MRWHDIAKILYMVLRSFEVFCPMIIMPWTTQASIISSKCFFVGRPKISNTIELLMQCCNPWKIFTKHAPLFNLSWKKKKVHVISLFTSLHIQMYSARVARGPTSVSLREHGFAHAAPKTGFVINGFVDLEALHGVHGFAAHPAFLQLDGRPHALAPADLWRKNGRWRWRGIRQHKHGVSSSQRQTHATNKTKSGQLLD